MSKSANSSMSNLDYLLAASKNTSMDANSQADSIKDESGQREINQALINARMASSEVVDSMRTSAETLDSTKDKFANTGEIYSDYYKEQDHSKKHIKQLRDQHKKNVLFVYGSFFFFLSVVGYIWIRRLLYNKFLYYIIGIWNFFSN